MCVQLNVHNHHSGDVEFVTYTNDGLVCCTRSLPFQYDGDRLFAFPMHEYITSHSYKHNTLTDSFHFELSSDDNHFAHGGGHRHTSL